MNFCIENKCSACCVGMIHQRITARDGIFLLGNERYIYVSRNVDFQGLLKTAKKPVVYANSRKNPLMQTEHSQKKVSVLVPGRCKHLNGLGLCDDYENRAESCKNLQPGNEYCLDCRE